MTADAVSFRARAEVVTRYGCGCDRVVDNAIRMDTEMPHIITPVADLVAAAEREIETLPVRDAVALHGRDDIVFVDLRDIRELTREGRVPGAFHCPRGMLEFWIDPASKYHKPLFAQDKRFVFFCAAGQRSALATQMAQRMGLTPVAHIAGGFTAWKNAGGPVEAAETMPKA